MQVWYYCMMHATYTYKADGRLLPVRSVYVESHLGCCESLQASHGCIQVFTALIDFLLITKGIQTDGQFRVQMAALLMVCTHGQTLNQGRATSNLS